MLNSKYLYKNHKVTVWATQDDGGKWEGKAIIESVPSGTKRPIHENFPLNKFDTEEAALAEAKRLAEDQVDNLRRSN